MAVHVAVHQLLEGRLQCLLHNWPYVQRCLLYLELHCWLHG